jgi:hypothetical protein
MFFTLIGFPVIADSETEVLRIWPPPSPADPSISMQSADAKPRFTESRQV